MYLLWKKGDYNAPTRPAYPVEFRGQIVVLYQAGRSISVLAREFEPSEQAIRNRIEQADMTPVQRRPDG
jgi:transposase